MTTRLPRITEVSPLSEGALHVEAISWPTTPPGEAAQAGPTRRVLPCGRFRQASRSRPIGLASAKCAACVRRACDLRAGCGHTACNRPTCGREGRIRSSARTGRKHNPLQAATATRQQKRLQRSKLPGLQPLFVGMDAILTESVLPPKYVRGTLGKVDSHRAARAGSQPGPRPVGRESQGS